MHGGTQNTMARATGQAVLERAGYDVQPDDVRASAPFVTVGPYGQAIAGGSAVGLAHYFAHKTFGDEAAFDLAGVIPAGIAVTVVGALVAVIL